MNILKKIADSERLNIVGIPKTIDNDIGVTEYSTRRVDCLTKALDSLQSTAASHSRAMVLEVIKRCRSYCIKCRNCRWSRYYFNPRIKFYNRLNNKKIK